MRDQVPAVIDPRVDDAGTVGPRLPPSTRFTPELTPTWLGTVALLAGHRPPELDGRLRVAYLGCGRGETAAVIAAVHPSAEVTAWDWRIEHIEATRRLRDAAGLTNLAVHEQTELPEVIGNGEPVDLVVVQELLAASSDDRRAAVVAAIRDWVRPGGLVCVTHPTLAGWTEIAPVQALMRGVALHHRGMPEDAVPEVRRLLGQLRSGGARFLVERPVVASWLDHLDDLDSGALAASYLRDPFRPMSPAQVTAALATAGCTRIGSARPVGDLDDDLAPELAELVGRAPGGVIRATYRDLASRRSHRVDLYRRGGVPLTPAERAASFGALRLRGLNSDEAPTSIAPDVWRRLHDEGISASELADPPAEASARLARLMEEGRAHPVLAVSPAPAALAAAAALEGALGQALQVDASLGTARPTAGMPS